MKEYRKSVSSSFVAGTRMLHHVEMATLLVNMDFCDLLSLIAMIRCHSDIASLCARNFSLKPKRLWHGSRHNANHTQFSKHQMVYSVYRQAMIPERCKDSFSSF